ncbi:iron-containing alcohol dehydrogenase [Heliobacterium chlorum]|uniref:Iron-containing alcohol dehydrogenase n=1 Tax=Heliobacterium chlorum TaxID=2698 RepID=A0ABR7T7X7_HELCL|nr:iron-containing alcohol dehydrogenase [Heliobacterium chlorum]MBC9786070.1 iron-containing alcohol dehydrogenase [Heliobacterium chlorum]
MVEKIVLGGQAIVAGRGAIEHVKTLDAKRAMIVTGGQSMFANGAIGRIEEIFQQKGCATSVFMGIGPNPDTSIVLQGLEQMRTFGPDVLIAIGGGSALDAAKVMSLFYEYPEISFENVLTIPLPERRQKLTFVAIPSTSGTGSEVTKASVITFKEQNLKIGLKTTAMIPDIAILDGEITMSMPPHVVAETGMDALTHAVESYINRNMGPFMEPLAQGAVEGIFANLPASYLEKSPESRDKMHLYQCMAGLAFNHSGLGMAHGIAHAVGGRFGLGHGLLNAILLPYVLRFNRRDREVTLKLQRLAHSIGSDDFVDSVEQLNRTLHIPSSFRETGIVQEDFEKDFADLVEKAMKGSTRVNPVPVRADQMIAFLQGVFQGDVTAIEAIPQ